MYYIRLILTDLLSNTEIKKYYYICALTFWEKCAQSKLPYKWPIHIEIYKKNIILIFLETVIIIMYTLGYKLYLHQSTKSCRNLSYTTIRNINPIIKKKSYFLFKYLNCNFSIVHFFFVISNIQFLPYFSQINTVSL